MKKVNHWYDETATGIVLRAKPTSEQWKALGLSLAARQRSLNWAIGDWLLMGADQGYLPRGKLDEAAGIFQLSRGTIANVVSVCRAIECSRRREDLPWSHHLEVAGRQDAGQLLAWASDTGASRSELRAEIRRRAVEVTPRITQVHASDVLPASEPVLDPTQAPRLAAPVEYAQRDELPLSHRVAECPEPAPTIEEDIMARLNRIRTEAAAIASCFDERGGAIRLTEFDFGKVVDLVIWLTSTKTTGTRKQALSLLIESAEAGKQLSRERQHMTDEEWQEQCELNGPNVMASVGVLMLIGQTVDC